METRTDCCDSAVSSGRMSVSKAKKLKWFDLGAKAFEQQRPNEAGAHQEPMYVCPTCVRPFPRSAVASGDLTAEHVPPECFDGHELILTCRRCNNTAGAYLDAHADRKEKVEAVLGGRLERVQRVKVTTAGVTVNAELFATGKEWSVTIPHNRNPPGTAKRLRDVVRKGTEISVDFSADRFAELGAKISWFRSGYLLLFAVFGYGPVFDSALDIVRRQILEPDAALIKTFTITLPESRPWTEVRLLKVVEPADHSSWGVQFGRYVVLYPLSDERSFYERLAQNMAGKPGTISCETYEWPARPSFGLS